MRGDKRSKEMGRKKNGEKTWLEKGVRGQGGKESKGEWRYKIKNKIS